MGIFIEEKLKEEVKKKVIAFVTPRMIIGGAESYIITKTLWLINNGFTVIVISSGGENVNNLPDEVRHFNIERIDDSPLLFKDEDYVNFIEDISNILTENRVDIIEAHNTFPVFHIAMSYRLTGIAFFANILHELSYVRNPLLAILTRKLNYFGLYYTLTSEMNNHIERTISTRLKPTILPIPVKGIEIGNDNFDQKYILSVCRLVEDKMYVKHLIDDFCKLYLSNKIARAYSLVIVGDGPLFEELEILASKFNESIQRTVIELRGTIVGDELEVLYKECSLFVGMGTSLLLAASCGKPSIIAGFTSNTEQFSWGYWGENELDKDIIAGGDNQNRKKTSLCEAIEIIVESDERSSEAGLAARKMFVKYYDFNSIMVFWKGEYIKIIEKATNNYQLEKKMSFSNLIKFLKVARYIYKRISFRKIVSLT